MSLCRSRSRFGACGLDANHGGDLHAVPIGDEVWFGYTRGRGATAIGYGKFTADGFRLLNSLPAD